MKGGTGSKGLLLVMALALVAACGGGTTVTGVAVDGENLFSQTVLGENAGCVTCHSLQPNVVLVGPSLATIGAEAGSRISGVSAIDYVRTSITNPDSHVVAGFDPGRMPQDWAEQLSADEIEAIVQYLLTLGAD